MTRLRDIRRCRQHPWSWLVLLTLLALPAARLQASQPQSILCPPLLDQVYGVGPITLIAEASSGLPVQFEVSGPAVLSEGTLYVTGVGTVTIIASQPGNDDYAAASPVTNAFLVLPKTLTISSGIYALNKTYDATPTATVASNAVALVGVVNGDSIDILTNNCIAFFDAAAVGETIPVQVSGLLLVGPGSFNYQLEAPTNLVASILPAPLTIGTTNFTKPYGETLVFAGTEFSATGLQGTDSVKSVSIVSDGSVSNAPAGTYEVFLSGAQGSGLSNYDLSYQSGSLQVSPALLTVGVQEISRPYGQTNPAFVATYSGFVNNESETMSNVLTGAPAFDTLATNNSPVGQYLVWPTNGTLAASNYFLVFTNGVLTVDPAIVTGAVTVADKLYDGTSSATIAGYQLDGIVGNDAVTLAGGVAEFPDKSVGTNRPVTITGLFLAGDAATNYTLAGSAIGTTANLSPAPLAISAAGIDKVYDGTTNATVSLSDNRVPGDQLTVGYTAAAFDDRHAGSAKLIHVQGLSVLGSDADNYTWNADAVTTGQILPMPIEVTAVANSKVYDGSTAAAAIPGISSGALAGTDSAAFRETYDSPDVGTNKTMIPAGDISDGNGGLNYTVTYTSLAQGTISVAPVQLLGVSAQDKIYDTTRQATLSFSQVSLQGITNGDQVAVQTNSYQALFANPDAGSNITVAVSGLALAGDRAANYSISAPSLAANIAPASTSNAVQSSSNPALPGALVTFTASLTPVAPGAGQPTGSIYFLDGTNLLGSVPMNGSGVVALATSGLPHGSHRMTVEYAGDANFHGSTNTLSADQVINALPCGGVFNLAVTANANAVLPAGQLLVACSDPDGDPLSVVSIAGLSQHGGSASLVNSTVSYTPPADYVGTDSFAYTVSDSWQGMATGLVQVTVGFGSQSGALGQLTRTAGGSMSLSALGYPGYLYAVQATTNLSDPSSWTTIGTARASALGKINFNDGSNTNGALRFYRIAAHSAYALRSQTFAGTNAIVPTASGYVNCGAILPFETNQAWTITAGIKASQLPTADKACVVICKIDHRPAYRGYELWVDSNGHLISECISDYATDNRIAVIGTTDVVDGNWHSVAVTYDGSSRAAGLKLYVDGVLETATVWADNLSGSIVGTAALAVGTQLSWPEGEYFQGSLDEVAIADVARSPEYLAAHAAPAALPEVDSHTLLNYHFDEGSGSTVQDASGHGRTGTLTGNIWAR